MQLSRVLPIMSALNSKPVVVITGVSGYLGSQVCLTFLQDGSYRVRGTVRSTTNAQKLEPLKAGLGPELFDQLELVEADLTNEDSIVAACEGATYVVHTASPFHFKGDTVGPAVQGATAVMKACTQHKVKLCVLTSSCAACLAPAKADAPVPPNAYDETCWSNPDRPEGLNDYMKSKTLAEKVAWEYQAEQAPGSFDLVTILPTFIMGPAPCGDGTSVGFMKSVLNGSQSEIPRGMRGFVDVRDVAMAHLKAIQIPEAANQRFILYNERVPSPTVYGWLAPFNETRGAKVPTKLGQGEDKGGDLVDNSRSKQVLKIDYTPLENTMTEHAEQILARGL
jgi:nucleoside-diphosphate-sugar epimerase